MINVYGSIEKDFDMVEDYITEMIENNMTPNTFVYNTLIKVYMYANNQVAVNSILEQMDVNNVPKTQSTFNTLISACAHSQDFDKAEFYFNEMKFSKTLQPDLSSYNTMIKVFTNAQKYDKADFYYSEMVESGIRPNRFTRDILNTRKRKGRLIEKWN